MPSPAPPVTLLMRGARRALRLGCRAVEYLTAITETKIGPLPTTFVTGSDPITRISGGEPTKKARSGATANPRRPFPAELKIISHGPGDRPRVAVSDVAGEPGPT
jgi:hypothetical protein